MDETAVVTVFLRTGGDVLLLRRSDAVGSYAGRWGAVAGHVDGHSDAAAREEIREETGIDPDAATTLVRAGEPFEVEDATLDTRWLVHPYLFECATRDVTPNEETDDFEWVPPTEILRRETVPQLWTSYDRVRPRVETVAADREHGSAHLSLRALEALRDEAALAVEGRPEAEDREGLVALARRLVAARPSMPVVRNRVDRAMSEAGEAGASNAARATPEALERAATAGIERALAADADAAALAADRLAGARIATLSRSGTVRAAIEDATPEAVLVAESRPGGEGVGVAGELAASLAAPVTLTTDAAFPGQLVAWNADALLVGADAIHADDAAEDGRLVNKVGTRGAAAVAADAGVEVVAVAASDKVTAAGTFDPEERPASELSPPDGVAVANPTFGETPLALVDAVVSERGVLDAAAVRRIGAEHRELAAWRE